MPVDGEPVGDRVTRVGPTPSTSASCSGVAAARARCRRRSPPRRAPPRGRCAGSTGPTRNLSSGRVLASSRLVSSLRPLADSAPDLVVKNRPVASFSSVRSKRSPSSTIRPASSSACRTGSPAPRCPAPADSPGGTAAPAAARDRTGCWGSAGRRHPPSRAAARCRTPGSCVGITNSRSLPSRRSTTGPTISGMTSPALRSTTRVADQHALALDLARVVQGGHPDRRPRHQDRLHHPERRDPPGPPDVDLDVEQLGGDLLRRVLEGDRPARCPRRRAELVLDLTLVELDHHTVDLVLDPVPVLAEVLDVMPTPRRGSAPDLPLRD